MEEYNNGFSKKKEETNNEYEDVENLPEGKIDQSISDYAKHYEIDIPKILINLAYTRHTTPEDADHMVKLLQTADIVIPEAAGWEYSDYWLQTSGQKTINRKKSFEARVMSSVDGMKKDFVYVDLNKKELKEARRGNVPIEKIIEDIFLKKYSFEKVIGIFSKWLENEANMQAKRELKILKNLAPRIITVIKESDLLKNKKKIEVFMYLGSMHTFIGHQLKKRGENLDIIFPEKSYVYDKRIEIERKMRFGRKVTQEEFALAFFDIIQQYVLGFTGSDQQEARFSQGIVKNLTEDDIRKWYESLPKLPDLNMDILGKSVLDLIKKSTV